MLHRAFVLILVFCAPALAVGQAIERVPYAQLEDELSARIDFESYPKHLSPGQPLDGIAMHDGARFGERFAGQVTASVEGFDAVFNAPRGPLALEPGAPGENLAVEFIFMLSNQLKGIASPGFPAQSAGGEGAVSILFDHDQKALGFRVTSEPRPKEAGVPKGRMQVAFYRRDGRLLAELEVELEWMLAGYGFRRTVDVADIAGVTITNRDPQGVAIDDVIFDPNFVLGGVAHDLALPLRRGG